MAGGLRDFQRTGPQQAGIHQFAGGVYAPLAAQRVHSHFHTGLEGVAYHQRTGVHPFHQGPGVDPFRSRVPALDRRRIEYLLAHETSVQGQVDDAPVRGGEAAGKPGRARHQFGGALYLGVPGLGGAEGIREEQGPQGRPNIAAGLSEVLSYFLGRRFVRGIGYEEGIELEGDEPTAGRVLTDDVQYVFSVEPAGLAQERLGAVVVILGPVLELPVEAAVGPDGVPRGSDAHVVLVGYGPTGERTGAGLDVVLVIGPDAH